MKGRRDRSGFRVQVVMQDTLYEGWQSVESMQVYFSYNLEKETTNCRERGPKAARYIPPIVP